MKHIVLLSVVVVCATLALPRLAAAQTAPQSITTPDKVETRTAPVAIFAKNLLLSGANTKKQA